MKLWYHKRDIMLEELEYWIPVQNRFANFIEECSIMSHRDRRKVLEPIRQPCKGYLMLWAISLVSVVFSSIGFSDIAQHWLCRSLERSVTTSTTTSLNSNDTNIVLSRDLRHSCFSRGAKKTKIPLSHAFWMFRSSNSFYLTRVQIEYIYI